MVSPFHTWNLSPFFHCISLWPSQTDWVHLDNAAWSSHLKVHTHSHFFDVPSAMKVTFTGSRDSNMDILRKAIILPTTPQQEGPWVHTLGISLLQSFQALSSPSPLSCRESQCTRKMHKAYYFQVHQLFSLSVWVDTWRVWLRFCFSIKTSLCHHSSCRLATKGPMLFSIIHTQYLHKTALLWTINFIIKWKRWENIAIMLGVDYFQESCLKSHFN